MMMLMMIGFAAMAISAITVFAAHNCAKLQCGARQNKSLLMIAGFYDD